MLQQEIETRLAAYYDPYLQTDFLTAKVASKVVVSSDAIQVEIKLGYPHARIRAEILVSLHAWLSPYAADKKLNIMLSQRIEAHAGKQSIPGLPQVKNIIAVGSGKGGVGKSTIAINLALALAKEGAAVGILDADIYGPSQSAMLGAPNEKALVKDRKLQPIMRHGLQSMSIAYLVDPQAAMIWRGPMIGKAMQQMLHDTAWENLDYLIVDLPPGTGDIQLTLCQKIPVCGAVMVTTPQDLALLDVRRACAMFQQLQVPILGVIENMSVHTCSHCGHEEQIFGADGAEKLAKEFGFTVLQSLPLDAQIRTMTDEGFPPVLQAPDGAIARKFAEAARHIAAKLALQRKDYSRQFPPIVVT